MDILPIFANSDASEIVVVSLFPYVLPKSPSIANVNHSIIGGYTTVTGGTQVQGGLPPINLLP